MSNREKSPQFVAIGLVSFTWFLFISSTHNYRDLSWYHWLWFSRLLSSGVGVALIFLLLRLRNRRLPNLTTQYLVFSLAVQTSHGALEGSRASEFFSFTGVFFMAACLAYKGSFRSWLRTYFPLQLAVITAALLFKSPDYLWPLPNLIDHFSLPIVGIILGVVMANLTTTKFAALQENLHLKERLLEEERKLVKVASQVAHDIRSPLTVLELVTGDLAGISTDQRRLIKGATTRMRDIADDLLNQRREKSLRAVLLKEVIEPLVQEKRQQYRSRPEVHLEVNLENLRGASVMVQKGELARMLSNILNNAYEAISGSGSIQIATKKFVETVQLEILDSGSGWKPDLLARAFTDGLSAGKVEGSGLGLSHCQNILRSWGGDLVFSSRLGRGTCVTLTLPRHS